MAVKESEVSAGRHRALHVRRRVMNGKAALDVRPSWSRHSVVISMTGSAAKTRLDKAPKGIVSTSNFHDGGMRFELVIDVGKATIRRAPSGWKPDEPGRVKAY